MVGREGILRVNPNTKKPTSNVVAGKLGRPFVQDTTSPMDMRAPVKGNLQGKAEKRLSQVRPTGSAAWSGYSKPNGKGPPASTNWRATARPMPGKRG